MVRAPHPNDRRKYVRNILFRPYSIQHRTHLTRSTLRPQSQTGRFQESNLSPWLPWFPSIAKVVENLRVWYHSCRCSYTKTVRHRTVVILLLNIPSLHDHDVLNKAVGAHFWLIAGMNNDSRPRLTPWDRVKLNATSAPNVPLARLALERNDMSAGLPRHKEATTGPRPTKKFSLRSCVN